ncbi:MAG TPA: hypothetical protein DD761_03465 [Cyanobacteria bacterium UBA11691]|nr:hypothetical protein [Cyanobacteria bacterium UBA11691]
MLCLLIFLSFPALAQSSVDSIPPDNLSSTQQQAWDQLVCLGDLSCRQSGQYSFPYQGVISDSSDSSPTSVSNPRDRVNELLEPYIPSREDLDNSQSYLLDWFMPPAYAGGLSQSKDRAYRAIDSIGSAAQSSIDWFVPVSHIMLSTMLSYRLTFYLIHGPKNS